MASMDDLCRMLEKIDEEMGHRFEGMDERFEKMDERFEGMDERFESFKTDITTNVTEAMSDIMDNKFAGKFEELDGKIDSVKVDAKAGFDKHEQLIEDISKKMSLILTDGNKISGNFIDEIRKQLQPDMGDIQT